MPEHGSEQEIQQYAPASKKRQVHMRRPDVLIHLQIVILIMCNI
jgi:hypothetical protein